MVVSRREFLTAAAATPALLQLAAPGAGVRGLDLRDEGRRVHQSVAGQASPRVEALGTREALKLGDERDGFVYIPKGYVAGTAMPLLFMLHGAGGTALSVQYTLPLADEFGVIVLAPDSRDERTWDGVLRHWGPDVEFMAAALEQTAARYAVNMNHLGVGGFSDGASYSLSFGISYGDQFGRVIAMSPGVMQPIAARGKPRIFLSHGTSDPIMPIDATSRVFAPRLKSLGYDVTYREYDGRHSPSPPIVRAAFQWFVHA